MNSTDVNKVTLDLAKKPIIVHIVHFMKSVGIKDIVVVVGFAKESVMEVLKDESVLFAEQTELLGTGHAAQMALDVIPRDVTDVFVVYGDDAVFYRDEHRGIMQRLFREHLSSDAAFTFLTIEQDDPTGLEELSEMKIINWLKSSKKKMHRMNNAKLLKLILAVLCSV